MSSSIVPALVEDYTALQLTEDGSDYWIQLEDGTEVPFSTIPIDVKYYNPQTLQGDPEEYSRLYGKWHFPFLDDVQDTLKVVPICELVRRRTMWADDGSGGNSKMSCGSPDGEYPFNWLAPALADRCGKMKYNQHSVLPSFEPHCENAKFGSNGEAPACSESRFVLFLDLDLLAPIGLWFNGKAISEWNAFAKNHFKAAEQRKFIRRSQANQVRPKNVAYWMSQKPEKNRVSLVWEKDNEIPTEEINKFQPLVEMYRAYFFKRQEDFQAQMNATEETEEAEKLPSEADTSLQQGEEASESLENFDMQ